MDYLYWIRYHIYGGNVHSQYYTYDYNHNQTYEFTGEKTVDSSIGHKLVLSRSTANVAGCFDNVCIQAQYTSGGGSKR